MKAKKWVIGFTCMILASLIFIMSVNFFYDPFGYFRAQGGDCYNLNEDYYLREIKAEHLKNYSDNYDAYIIGGSKAGALKTSKFSELDGYRYYNVWQLSGNFQDYYYYTKYIVENCNPKKIVLHISTSELKRYNRESFGDIYELPAEITGASKTAEVFEFLFKNLSATYDDMTKVNFNGFYPCFKTGERNLGKYYNYMRDHRDTFYNDLMKAQVDEYLPRLSTGAPEKSRVVSQSIETLREIKDMCDKNNIEFQCVIGSVFLGEMIGYEGDSFYDFLEQIVQVTGGVWCFNTFNDLAYNPYNYYNSYHYFYEIGDLMVDVMKAGETNKETANQVAGAPDGFGKYLTMDNLSGEIEDRKVKLKEVQDYYKENNALPYKAYDDASNYKRAEKEKLSYSPDATELK